jgi:hypothetical protein
MVREIGPEHPASFPGWGCVARSALPGMILGTLRRKYKSGIFEGRSFAVLEPKGCDPGSSAAGICRIRTCSGTLYVVRGDDPQKLESRGKPSA